MQYDSALSVRLRPLLVAAGLVCVSLAADASKPKLRLERIDASDFADNGTVRVYASIVELEGNVDDDRAAPSFMLKMDRKSLGRPSNARPFAATPDALDVVLVVEASALYGPRQAPKPPPAPPPPPTKGKKGAKEKAPKPEKQPKPDKGAKTAVAPGAKRKLDKEVVKNAGPVPLEKIKDAMHDLLEGMNPRFRLLLIDYGGDVNSHLPFRPPQSVESDIEDLSPDGEAGDLQLANAVRRAIDELKKPRAAGDESGKPARRIIVVISDGLNSQMDRNTFKLLGEYAAKARVPIHTIAYSPTDERGPLLNLGEISKRSNGTFRWARTDEELKAQLDTLGDELNKQYVLTYKIEARSLEGKKFQLTSDDLESNVLVYDSKGGTLGQPAVRPLIPWWLWLALGVVGVGALVVVMVARRGKRPKKAMKFSPYRNAAGQPNVGAQAQTHEPRAQAPAPQPKAQPKVAPQPQAPPQVTRGTLIIVSGALAGQRISVENQPVSIGKGPSTVQITDDPTVSTRHAELALSRGVFVLTDLGSTNGTFVNNQRITQPVRLSDGDLLRFGNTQMKLRTE